MDKTLKERCELYVDIVAEYYNLNKYYLTETAKDALSNAYDCMMVISDRADHLVYKFSGCDSHLPIIVQLANNSDFTDQMKEAFHTAQEALIEVFVHKKLENKSDEHIEELKRKIKAVCEGMKFYENPGPFDSRYIPKKAEDK